MSEEQQEKKKTIVLEGEEIPVDAADKEKLQEIVGKGAQSGPAMKGFWLWLTSGLGVFMVLFYFYNAGIAPVDTQYYLGIYVLITYILVFITYPMCRKSPQDRPSVLDIILACVAAAATGHIPTP